MTGARCPLHATHSRCHLTHKNCLITILQIAIERTGKLRGLGPYSVENGPLIGMQTAVHLDTDDHNCDEIPSDPLGPSLADVVVLRLTPLPRPSGADSKRLPWFKCLGCRARSSSPPHHSLPTMIHLIDAYVVGFSAFSFYLLKTYFEARVVWKQFGSVVPYFSCRFGRFKLGFSAT